MSNSHLNTPTRDIVFLFGAGASYGAGGILPEQPPLGSQLYPILARNYPSSWGAFAADIRTTFASDFEQGMQLVHDRLGGAIPALMRELAVYLIQFRPYKRSTLYDRLITDLSESGTLARTLFSTLNYDCVLEFCLIEQGQGIAYFDEGDAAHAPIWKLHGSCNMFSHGVRAGPGVSYGTGVTWEGGVEAFLDANRVIEHCLVETALAPVMCLYMQGKPLNVSPSAIRELQEKWKTKISNAAGIFCIGVRPLLQDTHIWEPLAATPAPLLFVGDKKSLEGWQKTHRGGATEFLGSKFNEAYPKIVERMKKYGT